MTFQEWPANPILKVIGVDPSLGKSVKSAHPAIVTRYLYKDGQLYCDCHMQRSSSTQVEDDATSLYVNHQPRVLVCESNMAQNIIRKL